MKNKRTIIGIDLFFCFVFIPLILFFIPNVDRWVAKNIPFLVTLLIFLYSVYFINSRILVPKLFFGQKKIYYLLCIIALGGAAYLLTQMPAGNAPLEAVQSKRFQGVSRMRTQSVWFLYTTVMMFSIITSILSEFYKQTIARQAVEIEKNKAELALYRAQINPHFLFNTLNTLYGLIIGQSDKAETVLIKITDILHYMYTDAVKEKISLEKEAAYIEHYISLQKYRLPANAKVNYHCSYKDGYLQVAPMILITFIENAFKYGVSASEPCNIDISIEEEDACLAVHTSNRNFKPSIGKPKGIGITNCMLRLEQLYPDKHTLDIKEANNQYIVNLTLKLNKS